MARLLVSLNSVRIFAWLLLLAVVGCAPEAPIAPKAPTGSPTLQEAQVPSSAPQKMKSDMPK